MELLVYIILIFVVVLPLVAFMLIPIYKEHFAVTNKAKNYDSFMQTFIYKVPLSAEDIIKSLSIANDADELTCTFDLKHSIVKIEEYGSNIKYYIQIEKHEGFSILKLQQIHTIVSQSHIPLKLHPYRVNKLQAEIVPFSECEF